MSNGALVDRFGRAATDLRVSLTDRCNLRCSYCMPAEGLDWLATPEVLTDDEVGRLGAAPRGAHRRGGGPADHDRGRAARRPGGPLHRGRAAAAARAARHRPA